MTTPKLLAEFHLDPQGKPIFTSANGEKHYLISLSVVDTPPNTYSVAYQLHETYVVPKRVVPRTVSNFRECITSYGDYEVNAAIMTRDLPNSPSMISDSLSNALKENYKQQEVTAEIQNAISDIATR